MNNEQHEALWKSVEHYLKQIEKEDVGDVSINGEDCACCSYSELTRNSSDDGCANCPIADYTGKVQCDGTPYYKATVSVAIAQNEDTKPLECKEPIARGNLEIMYLWLVELALDENPEVLP